MSYLSLLLLLFGFFLLIKGADLLVEGASNLAINFGMSLLTIGLTVVAFGTSAPELVVNILASIDGEGDLVLGNIMGSNIANILLVLGAAACVSSVRFSSSTLKLDLLVSVLGVFLLYLLLNEGSALLEKGDDVSIDTVFVLSRFDAFLFLIIFVIYQLYLFRYKKDFAKDVNEESYLNKKSIPISVVYLVLGLLGLGLGGRLIVSEGKNIAIYFADILGYEDAKAIVGLTVIAIGTSLPELVTSIVAVLKNKADMALGNIIGSNTFNILWVLGISALIKPLQITRIFYLEMILIIVSSMLVVLFIWMPKRGFLSIYQGYVMVILYVIYLGYLLFPV